MKFLKKQTALWCLVLIIAVAALAMPSVPRVSVATKPQSDEEEYWSRRVERRLDRRQEYLDRQTGDDKDDAEDSKDAKDSKDSKDAKDDDEDDVDDVDKDLERRREYWRKRLDDDW